MSQEPSSHPVDQRLQDCHDRCQNQELKKQMARLLGKPGQLIFLKKVIIRQFEDEEG
jgi:hypothetical protein